MLAPVLRHLRGNLVAYLALLLQNRYGGAIRALRRRQKVAW